MLTPSRTSALWRVASTSRALGELDEARASFEALVAEEQTAPEYAGGAWYHLAMMREEAGDRAAAQRLLERCLALLPNHRKAADALSRSCVA